MQPAVICVRLAQLLLGTGGEICMLSMHAFLFAQTGLVFLQF